MVDWNGLFKWSMQHQDGTKPASEFKPMDEESLQWLESAMEEFTFSEIKAMKSIIEELKKPEEGTPQDGERRLAQLDTLETLLESVDRGRDFFKLGGFPVLLKQMLESQYADAQVVAMRIFGSINQNNSALQDESIGLGAFSLLNFIAQQPGSAAQGVQPVREQAYSTLCMLLRGENLQAKRKFLDYDGLEFALKILRDEGKGSRKLRTKSTTLLKDLCQYDAKLHQTFSHLDKFTNTNSSTKLVQGKESVHLDLQEKKKQQGVWFDENDELHKLQFLPENVKYQNLVRQRLVQYNFVSEFWWILEDLQNTNIDAREQFLQIVQFILRYDCKAITAQQRESLKEHAQKLQNQMAASSSASEGVNQTEIDLVNDLLQEDYTKHPDQLKHN
jgi:hypothetical protein